MSRIDADRDAIRAFRDQLLSFVERQRQLIDNAPDEIERTLSLLNDAENRWKVTREHWEHELYNCRLQELHALQTGGYVDCSGFEREVERANDHYLRVIAWQRRVEQRAVAFAAVASGLADFLDWDFRSADDYLADRIKALEEFLAGQVSLLTPSGIRSSIWRSFRPTSSGSAAPGVPSPNRSGGPERGPGGVESEPSGSEREG